MNYHSIIDFFCKLFVFLHKMSDGRKSPTKGRKNSITSKSKKSKYVSILSNKIQLWLEEITVEEKLDKASLKIKVLEQELSK